MNERSGIRQLVLEPLGQRLLPAGDVIDSASEIVVQEEHSAQHIQREGCLPLFSVFSEFFGIRGLVWWRGKET